MPAEVFKLILDNSNLKSGLKESEAQAAASTSAITASLQKIGDGGAAGSKGIHLVNDSLKVTRAEIKESNGTMAMLGETIGLHIPRHARTMISSIEGIGPALSAAFNSVAIIAVGMAIFEAGKKVYEFFAKQKEAEEKAKTANEEFAASLTKSNLELEVANDKIEKHIAVLEKKPYNGLKAALDEAALSAFDLATKLNAAIQKERELLQSQDHGVLAQNLEGKGGTAASQGHLNTYNTDQNNIDVDFQNQLDEAKRLGKTKEEVDAIEQRHLQAKADLTVRTYNIVKEELDARKEMATLASQSNVQRWQTPGSNARLAELQKRFGTTTESVPAMEDMLGNLGMLGHKQQLEATSQQDRTTEAGDEEKNRLAGLAKEALSKANAETLKTWEKHLKAIDAEYKQSHAQEYDYWEKLASTVKQGSALYEAATDRANAARIGVHSDQDATNKKFLEEQLHQTEAAAPPSVTQTFEAMQAADKTASQNDKKAAEQTYKNVLADIEADEKLKEEMITLAVAMGNMSQHDAAVALRDLHDSTQSHRVDAYGTAQNNGADLTLSEATKRDSAYDIQQQKDNHSVDSGTISGAMRDDLHKFSQDGLDFPNKMKQMQDQFLQGMNANIGALILGEKTNWASFLKQLAGTLIGNGLKALEGGLLGMAHFADGGYTGTDPIVVGERGIEVFNPGNGGTITPNHKLSGSGSGGVFYYIDAKEGDTATLNRNMMRGLMAVHGQAVQDAQAVQREKQARVPRGSW